MSFFDTVPIIFISIIGVLTLMGIAVLFVNLDWSGSDAGLEHNLDKTTGFVVENVIPTEFNWISWLTERFANHPYILLIAIISVLWLFGYFLPK